MLTSCESVQNHLFLGSICMSPKAPKTQPPSPCFDRFGAAPVACIVRLSCKMHQNRSSTLRWSLTENRTGVVVSLSNRIKLNDALVAGKNKKWCARRESNSELGFRRHRTRFPNTANYLIFLQSADSFLSNLIRFCVVKSGNVAQCATVFLSLIIR